MCNRVFLTGDTHADFGKLWRLHKQYETTKDDIVIILGDSGLNYMTGGVARITKENLSRLPLTVACVHGNHEQRPECIPTYIEISWNNGRIMMEEMYPSLIFLKDGECYSINGQTFFVIGGAFSPDKQYRIAHKYPWFDNEQPSEETKKKIIKILRSKPISVDFVLTHTCPYTDIPIENLNSEIQYENIDYSTEKWLDEVKSLIEYKHWYCGHYHIDYQNTNFSILYNEIIKI